MERAQYTAGEIKDEIRRLIAEVTERSPEEVTDDAHFVNDLGMDSLMALEVMIDVDKRYKIELPEEEFHQLKTIGDTVALVQRCLVASTAS